MPAKTSSADMAMNPRDAANAKGCIDAVKSFTNTKLLPHVPEMTSRLIHSVENGKFPMRLPQINFYCFDGKNQPSAALVRTNWSDGPDFYLCFSQFEVMQVLVFDTHGPYRYRGQPQQPMADAVWGKRSDDQIRSSCISKRATACL
jgi:hypothetical protein